MSPVQVDVHQKRKPWPGYFLVHTTGEAVPLIAVDELPNSINVVGVPRSIDLEETMGMLNLGLQHRSGCFYQIVQKMESKTQVSEAVGKTGKSSDISRPPSSRQNSSQGSICASSSTRTSFPKSPTTSTVSCATSNSTTSTAATQLCRHWCTHGICKWGQKCRYLHIMPMTLHGLQEVDLSDWPIWFRKENPGYFVSDLRGRGVPGRTARGRRVIGSGTVGAGACCSPKFENGVGVRSERLRGNGNVAVREKESARVLRSGDLGEQTIVRLRGMSKEGKVIGERVLSGDSGGGNSMIERVTVRDTKNWEDESDDPDDDETNVEGKEKAMGNVKLVDV